MARVPHKKTMLPLLALVLGAAASLFLFAFVKDSVEKEAKLRFERQAGDAKHAMETRIVSYFNVLHGLAALFNRTLSRAEFHHYFEALDLTRRYPGIRGLNYAEHVTRETKARFEARVRRDTSLHPEGYPDFAIKPPGDRAEYLVLSYVEPEQEGKFALGLDLLNNPRAVDLQGIREAVESIRDSGKFGSSGQRIEIGQGNTVALGMRVAVYRRGMPRDTVAQRRTAYAGSVGAGFVVRDLMRGVFDESTLQRLRIRLYDAGSVRGYVATAAPPDEQRLLFDSGDPAISSATTGDGAFFQATLPTEIASRIWEIRVSASREALITGVDRVLPWLALGGGLFISVLLFAIFYSIAAAAERVEVARGKAVEANTAKTKFLAAASHDLRQPMQALSMYVSLLEERVSGVPRALPVVHGAKLSVKTLEQLFDGLLDISKIESGVIEPKAVAFPLMPLIDEVAAAERPMAEHKSLELRIVRTSAWVRSDPLLLGRMLKNLVTNAIRYTDRGRITVGCRRLGCGGLRIDVLDTGVGISAGEQERIFEEYYQISGASAQGLGLGLPIVKSLGALLGHAVAVRSVPGRGSAFSIALERAPEGALPSADPGVSAADPLSGINVVLVDDDAEIRRSMRLLLESWGCRWIGGATAAEVEEKLRTERLTPDALIVDYRLADATTGFEAIERLRAAFGSNVPALVISGTLNVSDVRERDPGVPIAIKPVSPGKLRAFLSQIPAA